MRDLPLLGCGAAILALGACTVGPDYRSPAVALPAVYRQGPPEAARPPPTAALWWTRFDDRLLDQAVDRALDQNLSLESAGARIAQSRAAAKSAGAALLPSAQFSGSVADVSQSLLTPFGSVGRNVPGFERDYDLYDVGASASWELDLFGGLRRSRQAARADLQAAILNRDAVKVSVAAETADAYLQVRAFQARLGVARRQEQLEVELVALLERRFAQGVAAERELHQARSALEGVRATLPPLRAGEVAQLARLDVLMGAPAGTHDDLFGAPDTLPAPPSLQGLGTPADLLRRRPDVMAAERQLAAADARIGVAVSDYYPKVSLTALLGVESLDEGRVFAGDALQHSITGGLRWRLFDFGRVDAEVANARGRRAEALSNYRATVYQATADVENALASFVQAQAATQVLVRQVGELDRARAQVQLAYDGGAVSLIEVLDADRDLLTASDQLAQARAAVDRAAVASFRAVGRT